MIGRLMRLIFELLIVLVVASFALGLVLGLLREGGAAAASAAGAAIPRLIADVVATLLTGIFCVGLVVRAQRALRRRGARAGRDRDAQERHARVAVRRPAADVPVVPPEHGPAPDPDPALELGDHG
jgi:hypothetical protein